MNKIEKIDFRQFDISKGRVLTVTDPPYNIGFKYDTHKDKIPEQDFIQMMSHLKKPCVTIMYAEETIKYLIPALGIPDKVLSWCYNSHLPRAFRLVCFFGIKPDMKKYSIPYKNPTDKRVKKLIEQGSKGTSLKEWFIVEQCKNVSKEHQGYANHIPEEIIRIILKICEGQFDTVFDPFCGSGTTLKVAKEMRYSYIGTDIDSKAVEISKKRLKLTDKVCKLFPSELSPKNEG